MPKSKKPTQKKNQKKNVKNNSEKEIKKMVKQSQLSLAEPKTVRMTYYNLGADATTGTAVPYYNSVNWAINYGSYIISPCANRVQITQGSGQGDRIGNQITTQSSILRFQFTALEYNATTNPMPKPVDILIIFYKIIGAGNSAQANLSGLYQSGNTQTSPSSNLLDNVLPFNTDLYRILKTKRLKIGSADNTGAGSTINYQYFANNDYKRSSFYQINITKYLDKVYKYSDNSATPNNDFLYCAVMAMPCDGSTPALAGNTRAVNMALCQEFRYKDM